MAGEKLGQMVKIDEDLIVKACSEAMKAHKFQDQPFLVENSSGSSSSSAAIFSFPGSWSEKDWFSNSSFGGAKLPKDSVFSEYLRSLVTNEAAVLNEAVLHKFETLRSQPQFLIKVEEAINEKKKIIFTGHSLGGPIAILATIWVFQQYVKPKNVKPPFCVTFGSPLVGDHILSHALEREKWSVYFIHFVMRYDIVPRILLAPLSSIHQQFNPILNFFERKSTNAEYESLEITNDASSFFKSVMSNLMGSINLVLETIASFIRLLHAPLSSIQEQFKKILNLFQPKSTSVEYEPSEITNDASTFFKSVMSNASTIASDVACNMMGRTNMLLETIKSFIQLSPYRPFGTYIFCTQNGKLVTLNNSDAVLQLLFYSCQLSSEKEVQQVAYKSLTDHFAYESELKENLLGMQDVVSLNPLENIGGADDRINQALDELGVSTAARLCLLAAAESVKQKQKNKKSMDDQKEKILSILKDIENYRDSYLDQKLGYGYFDAFKLQKSRNDFNANVKRLELAGIWDEIIEMLKRYELPDEFEGDKEWLEIGTRYRRLVEPLDIANYYRDSKNYDTGAYMLRGRPRRYRYTQIWREHEERMKPGTSGESCFLAEVEELRTKTGKVVPSNFDERVKGIQNQVEEWNRRNELGKDVFLEKSTFISWWKLLPDQYKSAYIEAQVISG